MGLDAVVYKNRTKLPLDPEHAGLRLDETTGEWYSETDNLPEIFRSVGREALSKRLGNVNLIATLREQLEALLPADSVLLGNVLYHGAHAGDAISQEKLGAL